ncbi:MAG: D-alanyl-D-alanine carboxypeptidase [Micavibrio sp.]|nr:D-alanyl-D-alanine carboxypeptidase [Micavibrio sp.]
MIISIFSSAIRLTHSKTLKIVPIKLIRNFLLLTFFSTLSLISTLDDAHAAENKKYASLVMDADTGVIIHDRYGSKKLHPASTTKIMTLMLAFEAIDAGKASLNDRIKISSHAASQVPSKLGLPAGSTIRMKDAILALVTKSANDISVAIAEHIGGTEKNFTRMMTQRASQIGMKDTTFVNPHGLHNPAQVTTARDMAILARYMIIHHPRDYGYFSTKQFTYNGKTYGNHNRLLGVYPGMDGLKTGFINASGFNLVASAKRNGRRIIGVVFGGRSAKTRNDHMVEILDKGFANLPSLKTAGTIYEPAPVPPEKPVETANAATVYTSSNRNIIRTPAAANDPIAAIIAQGDIDTGSDRRMATGYIAMDAVLREDGNNSTMPASMKSLGTIARSPQSGANIKLASASASAPITNRGESWAIQIGAFQSRVATEAALDTAKSLLPQNLRHGQVKVVPLRAAQSEWVFRARLDGYSKSEAEAACRHFRDCITISPKAN